MQRLDSRDRFEDLDQTKPGSLWKRWSSIKILQVCLPVGWKCILQFSMSWRKTCTFKLAWVVHSHCKCQWAVVAVARNLRSESYVIKVEPNSYVHLSTLNHWHGLVSNDSQRQQITSRIIILVILHVSGRRLKQRWKCDQWQADDADKTRAAVASC